LEYVEADNALAAEHQDDRLDKAPEVVNIDDCAVESCEWSIDHPHQLSFSRIGRCVSILVPLVAM
jgi:hypothetical protein